MRVKKINVLLFYSPGISGTVHPAVKYRDRIHGHETKEIFKHANKFAFFLMCCFNLLNASLFVTNSDYICYSYELDSFFFLFFSYHFDDRILCTISLLAPLRLLQPGEVAIF